MSKDQTNKSFRGAAKGQNPHFFDDPNTDRLVTMIMDLAAEVSVMRDRLDTHERLAASRNLYTPEDVDSFELSDEAIQERDSRRNEFLDRLLRTITATYDKT